MRLLLYSSIIHQHHSSVSFISINNHSSAILALLAIINTIKSGYQCASMSPTEILAKQHYELAKKIFKNLSVKIDFLTAPYDLDYIDDVNKYIPAFKIGSGDINWKESLVKIAKKNKPVIIASGASSFADVKNAIRTLRKYNKKIIWNFY